MHLKCSCAITKCRSINKIWKRRATFRSIYPDVQIPRVSYPQFMLEKMKSGEGTAMICGQTNRTISYSDLISGIRSVSSGLVKSGFQKNDVLCIYSANCLEYPFVVFGATSAGGVVTTANPSYTVDEFSFQLKNSGAEIIVTSKENFQNAAFAAKNSGSVKEIYVIDENMPGAKHFPKLLEDNGSADRLDEISQIDVSNKVAALLYSSGTTGLPKGVMLTHGNLVGNMSQCSSMVDLISKEDTLMGVLPLFHCYGLVPVLGFNFMTHNKIVIHKSFDPERFLSSIENHRITVMHLVPPLLLFLINHPLVKKYDLSSLTKVVCAAAPLKPETEDLFCKQFPNVDLSQAYGLTETTPIVTLSPPKSMRNEAVHNTKKGNAGVLVPNQQVKFIDPETGRDVESGERGELIVKGVNVMKGYLNNKKATDDCVKEGWFHSGDIGYIDEDGYVFIVDRIKELIKVKGLQVAPAELEGILLDHPAIQDAGVVGKHDDRAGEVPTAFVVLKKDCHNSEQEIYNWVSQRVSRHKHLDGGVIFINEIPKAASGKILRRVLRERLK